MPADLLDRTRELLDDVPPFLADAPDFQAVIDVLLRELDRVDQARATVRAEYLPTTADELLGLWESMLELSIAPPALTLGQRQQRVLAYVQGINSQGSGLEWEEQITTLIGTGWTYQEHDPADPTSPPPYTLRVSIPFADVIAAPTSLSGVVSGSGTLAAGTYYYAVTATNSYGETPPSNIINKTVGANGRVVLDWPDVTGATGYNVYRGPDAAHLVKLATLITPASAFTDDGSFSPTFGAPPVENSTQSVQASEALRLARRITPAHIALTFGYGAGFIVGVSDLGEFL